MHQSQNLVGLFSLYPFELTKHTRLIGNWKEFPNDENYQRGITAAGSPDLFRWTRDVLYSKVQKVEKEFSAKYGWGNPSKIKFGEGTYQQEVTAGPQEN
jgi:hypothetical protein